MKDGRSVLFAVPLALFMAGCGGSEDVVVYPESPEPEMTPASSPSPESPDMEIEREYDTPSGEVEVETEYDD